MEVTLLRSSSILGKAFGLCFNPCFNGSYSSTKMDSSVVAKISESFNPCFNGSYSSTETYY